MFFIYTIGMKDYTFYKISDGISKVAKIDIDWSLVISNLNPWHAELAEIILEPETIYYYVMNKTDSKNVPLALTSDQINNLKLVFKKFIEDPGSFYDVFVKNKSLIDKIDLLKSNDELTSFIEDNALDLNCDPSKSFEKNKGNIIRELKLDRNYGIFGEFLFYTVVREIFGKDLLLSKVSLTSGNQVYAFGSDGIFYNQENNILIFGEAKFTKNLKSGLIQAFNSLQDLKARISNDLTLIIQQTLLLKGTYSTTFEEKTYNDLELMEKTLYVFILHGENDYDDKSILEIGQEYLEKFKKIDSTLQNIAIISFPIIDKESLKSAIAHKVSENAKDN